MIGAAAGRLSGGGGGEAQGNQTGTDARSNSFVSIVKSSGARVHQALTISRKARAYVSFVVGQVVGPTFGISSAYMNRWLLMCSG
jgi:hypothetical protein